MSNEQKGSQRTRATAASRSCIAFGTGSAHDFAIRILHAKSAFWTGTRAAIVGTSAHGETVKPRGTALAVLSHRVVLADATARVDVARLRMTVAIAGHAARERSAVGRLTSKTRTA